jgi:hypothetical protein
MSYDPSLPTSRDKIRGIIGDTGTVEYLADETYDALLLGNTFVAAVRAAARFALSAISKRPDQIAEYGGTSMKWTERVADLRSIADGTTPIPFTDLAPAAPFSGQIEVGGADVFRK